MDQAALDERLAVAWLRKLLVGGVRGRGLLMEDLDRQAAQLAAGPYAIVIERDRLADGPPISIAWQPDLDGCVAQGETDAAALAELAEIRLKSIRRYLEHGVPVPRPRGGTPQRPQAADGLPVEPGERNPDRAQQAAVLATRPYRTIVEREPESPTTTICVAWNPEFSLHTGEREIRCCLADGGDVEAALANLAEARGAFIWSLLEDGLPVPEPLDG